MDSASYGHLTGTGFGSDGPGGQEEWSCWIFVDDNPRVKERRLSCIDGDMCHLSMLRLEMGVSSPVCSAHSV